MVRAVCNYNKDKVKNMTTKMRNKTLIGAIIFNALFLFMGIFNIVTSISSGEGIQKWLFIVLGAIICVFSFYPTASTLATHKKNYEETLTAMNLDKGDLTLDFTIKEKKIELRAIQAGEEEVATMLIRNFSQVKVNKDGVGLYINENMYYIENDEIVLGSKEELLKIFKNAKVTIKNRR